METQFIQIFTKVLLLVCIAITIDAMEKERRPSLTFTITNEDTEQNSIFLIEYSQDKNNQLNKKISILQNQEIIIKPEDQYWDLENRYFEITLNNSFRTRMNSLVFSYSQSYTLLRTIEGGDCKSNEIIDSGSSYIVPLRITNSHLRKLDFIRELASKNKSSSEN